MIAPTPYFSDRGCHIRIYNEIEALQTTGHSVVLYTYHLGRQVGSATIQRSVAIPWYNKTTAGPSWHKLYLDVLLWWKIITTVRREHVQLIHAHLHEGAWIGWWVKLFTGLPLILDAQGSLVAELDSYGWLQAGWRRRWFVMIERWIVHHVDYIFVSSTTLLQQYSERWPKLTEKMTVLADGILPRQPISQIANSALARTVIYTGGLTASKGINDLLRAIPLVVEKIPAVRFVIIGYPVPQPLPTNLPIDWVGQVDYFTLSRYLANAQIAVEPKPMNSTESSGKLLQYMAHGLAVVAFSSSHNAATLGQAGLLATTQSAEALAERIIWLLQHPEQTTALGQAAQRRAQNFSWLKIIVQATTVYEQMV